MPFISRMALSSSATLNRPADALNSWLSSSASRSPTRFTLSELEPALTTRTFIRSESIWPCPIADIGWVVSDLAGVLPVPHPLVLHELADVRSLRAQPGHAVDDVYDQVEAIQVVEHHHVEGGRRGALFLVATHVQVVVVGAAIREAVDQPRIPVICEHDRPVD